MANIDYRADVVIPVRFRPKDPMDVLQSVKLSQGTMKALSSQAWDLYNIICTLNAVLPDDERDDEVPLKSLTSQLKRMSDELACDLAELVSQCK